MAVNHFYLIVWRKKKENWPQETWTDSVQVFLVRRKKSPGDLNRLGPNSLHVVLQEQREPAGPFCWWRRPGVFQEERHDSQFSGLPAWDGSGDDGADGPLRVQQGPVWRHEERWASAMAAYQTCLAEKLLSSSWFLFFWLKLENSSCHLVPTVGWGSSTTEDHQGAPWGTCPWARGSSTHTDTTEGKQNNTSKSGVFNLF